MIELENSVCSHIKSVLGHHEKLSFSCLGSYRTEQGFPFRVLQDITLQLFFPPRLKKSLLVIEIGKVIGRQGHCCAVEPFSARAPSC